MRKLTIEEANELGMRRKRLSEEKCRQKKLKKLDKIAAEERKKEKEFSKNFRIVDFIRKTERRTECIQNNDFDRSLATFAERNSRQRLYDCLNYRDEIRLYREYIAICAKNDVVVGVNMNDKIDRGKLGLAFFNTKRH
jgi:hypothetical protein